jgi:hypothetical protein
VAKLFLAPGSGVATPRSSKVAPSYVTIQDAKNGAKGKKKRLKWRPLWVMAMADDDIDKEVDDSDMGYIMTAARSGKHQAWPPKDHFKRLLKEAYPNHVYHIKHKLKDYDMMKNFMISESLTHGRELKEDPSGSDMMPFPREDVVMTVYDAPPPPWRHSVCNLSPGTLTPCGWGPKDTRV